MAHYKTFGINVTRQGTAINKSYSEPSTIDFYGHELMVGNRLDFIENDKFLQDLSLELNKDTQKLQQVVVDLEIKLGIPRGSLSHEEINRILMTNNLSHRNYGSFASKYPQAQLDIQFSKKLKAYNNIVQRIQQNRSRVSKANQVKSTKPYYSYRFVGSVLHQEAHIAEGRIAFELAGMNPHDILNNLGTAHLGISYCPTCFN